jgi:hypothetical protein
VNAAGYADGRLLAGCVRSGSGEILATHDFQAPGFYERMGYEGKYAIEGCPSGHLDILYVKPLR